MDDDRRATLEAAMEASDQGLDIQEAVESIAATTTETTPDVATTSQNDATSAPKDVGAENATAEIKSRDDAPKLEVADEVVDKAINADRAPQAWKPAQKAKWAALDPDIRQEVMRREHETTRVLNDTAQVRQFAGQFQEAIQPYMARIQQAGHPIQAIQNLLAADHLLATGPKTQKAQYLAKLIKDYGVDIQELDAALAGTSPPDPVAARVEQMLQERLAPVQQFLTQQQQREVASQQYQQQQVAQTVQQMSTDPAFPHFDAVRDTMADLIDVQARRGVNVDLKTAYNMAVAMDPTISQQVASANQASMQVKNAATANAKAQRALRASASVSGTPGGSNGGAPTTTDRRAHLEAAFGAWEGR